MSVLRPSEPLDQEPLGPDMTTKLQVTLQWELAAGARAHFLLKTKNAILDGGLYQTESSCRTSWQSIFLRLEAPRGLVIPLLLLLLSRFSRVRLCATPIDGSPPGSSVPGILQARILEWVAISRWPPIKEQEHPHGSQIPSQTQVCLPFMIITQFLEALGSPYFSRWKNFNCFMMTLQKTTHMSHFS